MKPSRRVRLSAKARADIRSIVRFTVERWGSVQADAYRGRMLVSLERLADFPELGERRDELVEGLRSFPVERHVVFYRVVGEAILVERILHQRQDHRSQLLD